MVNNDVLSDFGDFAAISLLQMKVVFILTIYGNYIEMKNRNNECPSV